MALQMPPQTQNLVVVWRACVCQQHSKGYHRWSRLSFPATELPDPGRVSEGFLEGSLKGFEGSRAFKPKDPSKPLQHAFQEPFETFQEGVEIDDALGFPGA